MRLLPLGWVGVCVWNGQKHIILTFTVCQPNGMQILGLQRIKIKLSNQLLLAVATVTSDFDLSKNVNHPSPKWPVIGNKSSLKYTFIYQRGTLNILIKQNFWVVCLKYFWPSPGLAAGPAVSGWFKTYFLPLNSSTLDTASHNIFSVYFYFTRKKRTLKI